jgi:hypothetical protein
MGTGQGNGASEKLLLLSQQGEKRVNKGNCVAVSPCRSP